VSAEPPKPGRTRVVLGEVARGRASTQVDHLAQPGSGRGELADQGPVGDALLRGLVRAQLALALRFAALVLATLGGLPILFSLVPAVAQARPLGLSLPWLLLGLVAFPFLYGAGAVYVRIAERTEQEFTDLVERPER
jgi:hypothetical protein